MRLTTLTKEFFMPRFLERDEAEREPPAIFIRGTAFATFAPFHVSNRASSKAFIKASTDYTDCFILLILKIL